MAKILYLDLGMGAAGDMLTAALLDLMSDKDAFVDKLNRIGIPGVEYSVQEISKCGIMGTKVVVSVNGCIEGEAYEHDGAHEHNDHPGSAHGHMHEHADPASMHSHEHHHEHAHVHSSLSDIDALIASLDIPKKVKEDARAVYGSIAAAESQVHGHPIDQIHFHEVGTLDAVADVVAVCTLMHELSPDSVVASAVSTGGGVVHCAHGVLPVPAPATALLLEGIPTKGGPVDAELCTPTGAALIRHFVSSFGHAPQMTVESVGYGMGSRDFEICNCVMASFGESAQVEPYVGISASEASAAEGQGAATDAVIELSCNIDDMTPEALGFAIEGLLESGALDAFCTSIVMKKSRPAHMLSAICHPEDEKRVVDALFKLTTTIGVRRKECLRYVLERNIKTVDTSLGSIRVKESAGYGVRRSKLEFDDLASIASKLGMSIDEVRRQVEAELMRDSEA